MIDGVVLRLSGKLKSETEAAVKQILTPESLTFVRDLHRKFNPIREDLLTKRAERQERIINGEVPKFLAETESIRSGDWTVAPCPKDLQDRRVEITGPVERKMMINALNCGAKMFMADFEDSLSPTWQGVIEGQVNVYDSVRRTIQYKNPDSPDGNPGKEYKLNDTIATLLIRARGWHLEEKHILVDGKPISASLCDFGLTFFHNAKEQLKRGTGPYFYLPKLESHLEARLWNDVFVYAQKTLDVPHGSIKATVLIETILAAFEMDEILYELKDHSAGLNAGRWDYIFSVIKKFSWSKDFLFPDRSMVSMAVPFMRSYAKLLVKTCHKRKAFAMGGMAAFIPNRREPEVTKNAIAKVLEDKNREADDGFDGTWVAHPDLVKVAMEVFDKKLGHKPNQIDRQRSNFNVSDDDLINTKIDGHKITEAGFRNNVNVAIQYIGQWLLGTGAVAIYNLMEDAATAEISRAQLWQWLKLEVDVETDSGPAKANKNYFAKIQSEELERVKSEWKQPELVRAAEKASRILGDLVTNQLFPTFLTLSAYEELE